MVEAPKQLLGPQVLVSVQSQAVVPVFLGAES